MEKRYQTLRIIASLHKILGIVILLLTALAVVLIILGAIFGSSSLYEFSQAYGIGEETARLATSLFGGIVASLSVLVSGVLSAMFFLAVGEGIYLLIDMEENTRLSARALQHWLSQPIPQPTTVQTNLANPPVGMTQPNLPADLTPNS